MIKTKKQNMIAKKQREMKMTKAKIKKKLAKGTAAVLNATLRVDANSTSCMGIYQPKAPEELSRFRKTK